jgi:hypothetical protein
MNIYTVPEDRRYWVVRNDGGKYYDHFIKYGVIALGHLDELDLKESGDRPFAPDDESLKQSLVALHRSLELAKGRTTAHFHQIQSFLSEMKIGDWTLTIGDRTIRFGRIVGLPRIDKRPLSIVDEIRGGKTTYLDFNLRRNVVWGPTLNRRKLPYRLLSSLRANQTLTNIDAVSRQTILGRWLPDLRDSSAHQV